jgi:hypothetical protein
MPHTRKKSQAPDGKQKAAKAPTRKKPAKDQQATPTNDSQVVTVSLADLRAIIHDEVAAARPPPAAFGAGDAANASIGGGASTRQSHRIDGQVPTPGVNGQPPIGQEVAANPGMQLHAGVSRLAQEVTPALRAKIYLGEYIDFKLLLKENLLAAEEGDENNMSIDRHTGLLKFTSGPKVKLNCIERWLDAFEMFMAVSVAANPHKVHQYIAYQGIIRHAASHYSGGGLFAI